MKTIHSHRQKRIKVARPVDLSRRLLEAKIEELISLLDQFDGDPDIEEDGDLEPSLAGSGIPRFNRQSGTLEYDLELDCSDDEYTLGWSNPRVGELDIPKGWAISDDDDANHNAAFRGEGYQAGRQLLRKHIKNERILSKALDRIA